MHKKLENGRIIVEENSWHRWLNWAGIIASITLVIAGVVGLLYVQQPLQESQETRRAASVADGQVVLSTSPAGGATLTAGQEHSIELRLHTNGVQTDGAELVLQVVSNQIDLLDIQAVPESGLSIVDSEVEKVADGYLVHLIALPQFGATFSSTQPRAIAKLVFTPTGAGTATVTVDPDESLVTVHASTPPKDELKTATPVSYTIAAAATQEDVELATKPLGALSTPAPAGCYYQQVQCFQAPCNPILVCPTPSPAASPTNTGTGGPTYKQCNESCSSNGDCAANFRCYQNRCRLATNVSSESCAQPADGGLQRTCDQYCANTGECAQGYTCFYNRCRRPENPDSTTCSASTASTQQNIAANCNATCASNRDCAVNMRCYNGACRLATNPGSTSCSAATTQTVSPLYSQKGTETPGDTTPKPSSPSASVSPSPSASIRPSAAGGTYRPPTASPSRIATISTGLRSGWGNLTAWLRKQGTAIPMLALALGVGIMLVLVIMALLSALLGRRRKQSPQVGGPATTTPTVPATKYESDLQKKINQLAAEPKATPAVPAPIAPPTQPVVTPPAAPAPDKTEAKAEPIGTMTPPPSSMIERMRQKGLTPPQQHDSKP